MSLRRARLKYDPVAPRGSAQPKGDPDSGAAIRRAIGASLRKGSTRTRLPRQMGVTYLDRDDLSDLSTEGLTLAGEFGKRAKADAAAEKRLEEEEKKVLAEIEVRRKKNEPKELQSAKSIQNKGITRELGQNKLSQMQVRKIAQSEANSWRRKFDSDLTKMAKALRNITLGGYDDFKERALTLAKKASYMDGVDRGGVMFIIRRVWKEVVLEEGSPSSQKNGLDAKNEEDDTADLNFSEWLEKMVMSGTLDSGGGTGQFIDDAIALAARVGRLTEANSATEMPKLQKAIIEYKKRSGDDGKHSAKEEEETRDEKEEDEKVGTAAENGVPPERGSVYNTVSNAARSVGTRLRTAYDTLTENNYVGEPIGEARDAPADYKSRLAGLSNQQYLVRLVLDGKLTEPRYGTDEKKWREDALDMAFVAGRLDDEDAFDDFEEVLDDLFYKGEVPTPAAADDGKADEKNPDAPANTHTHTHTHTIANERKLFQLSFAVQTDGPLVLSLSFL